MSTQEPVRDLEGEFHTIVNAALDERWQRDGRYSAKEILDDLRENKTNDELWQRMAEQLAQRAAVNVIQRRMKTHTPAVDSAQEAFPFAKDLPVPAITYKRSVVSTLRATADEYLWFSNWSLRRHQGTVRRSKVDKKELARIDRFARLVRKNRGDNLNVTIEEIVRKRQERLAALRKQRKSRGKR